MFEITENPSKRKTKLKMVLKLINVPSEITRLIKGITKTLA